MSPSKLHALLRVERLGAVCPALRDGFRDGVLSWAQAEILAPLFEGEGLAVVGADPESDWRAAWVAYATEVTVRQLTEAVERARLWRDANPAGFAESRGRPEAFEEPDRDEASGALQTCARPTDRRGDLRGEVRLAIRAFAPVARLFDGGRASPRTPRLRWAATPSPARSRDGSYTAPPRPGGTCSSTTSASVRPEAAMMRRT